MADLKTNLYVFQWISDLGGADTRLKELLILLHKDFNITCVPNDDFRLNEKHNVDFLKNYDIKYCAFKDLPKTLDGFAYANCNFRLFKEKERINFIKNSGLIFLWSNDMMWNNRDELDCISKNLIDCCLFTSPFHKNVLLPTILKANKNQKYYILDNYFDSSTWPYVNRPDRNIVCGKVSRNDFMKFSENFPVFYESVSPANAKFNIMGWDDKLQQKYNWFNFSNRWSLMKSNKLKTQEYFESIDVFLYDCNRKFIENQSRAVIEAQLTGCPIVAPNKWNFPNMIWDRRTGFLWNTLEECREALIDLSNYEFRSRMGQMASDCTREIWCDADLAKKKFDNLLNHISGVKL